jgi:hypothetical protein
MPQQIEVPGMGVVEFPDGMSDDQIAAAIKQNMPATAAPAAQPQPSAGITDYLPRAITDIPGDIFGAGKAALGKIADNLNPFSDARRASIERQGKMGLGEGLVEGLKQTAGVGSGLAAIPELVASPMTGAARSLIGNPMATIERTIGEAINPEAAKARTDEQATADWKQSADVAMMAMAPRSVSPMGVRVAPTKAPTGAELKAAGAQGYDTARGMGLEVKPQAAQGLGATIKADLTAAGIDENLAPKTFGIVSKLDNMDPASVVTVSNLESLRRTLGNAAGSIDKTERMAAKSAQSKLDDWLANIPNADVIKGDPQAVSAILKEARANYAASERSAALDRKVVRAELRASAANSGQNIANTMRQRIADILINPNERRGYSADEIAQMEKIVGGTKTGNAARIVGNMLGGGGGLGTLTTSGLGALTMGPQGLALPLVGVAAKQLQNASTMRQVRKLDEMLRSRAPLATSAPTQMMPVPAGVLGAIPAAEMPALAGGLLGSFSESSPRKGVKRRAN